MARGSQKPVRRRDLLKNCAVLGAGAIAAGALPPSGAMSVLGAEAGAAGDSKPVSSVDVLVIGGGTAGAIAAIAAARIGVSTALVESGAQLGGTTTTGGVAYPGLFHAWGKQVIAGIGWEMVLKSVQLDTGILPDFKTPPRYHSLHQVRVNGPLYAAILEEAFLAAGGRLHFYEMPLAARAVNATGATDASGGDHLARGATVAGGATAHLARGATAYEVELVGKESRRTIVCKQLIDCTGDANLVGMLGHQRLREAERQPGTMMFELGDYDIKKLDPEQIEVIEEKYRQALREQKLLPGDVANPDARFVDFLRGRGSNQQHVLGADGSTSAGKTLANIAGRQSVLRLLRFIRTLPGCAGARVVKMQTETGIRETFRIVGETMITQDDFLSGRVFEDAVCHSFYPIDIHDERGVKPQPLKEGIVPTIPRGALIPKGSKNLMAAGRVISSDRAANSALRVQASCMAMGQAAGTTAALAARSNTTPAHVPIEEVRTLLRKHGAIVPGC